MRFNDWAKFQAPKLRFQKHCSVRLLHANWPCCTADLVRKIFRAKYLIGLICSHHLVPFSTKVHFAPKAAYFSYRQKDTKHVEVHESNDNLQKKIDPRQVVGQDFQPFSFRNSRKFSQSHQGFYLKSKSFRQVLPDIRKMEMESFKSAMNQAQTNWKCKPKLSMYKYMYMKSFKPAPKKKGLCFPTSKSMQRNESPAFTVRQKAASRRFTGFPQSPHRHPSEFSDETLRFRYIPGKITWQAGKIPIFNRKFIFQVVDFPIAMLVFGKVVWIFGQSSGLTTAIGEQPTNELTVLDLAISIGISLQECQPNGSCPNEVWPYGLNLD